jgi:5'(3')-deoxyribonucleotidase
MRLGIDLDGVVADFNAGWMALHAEEHGSDLSPDQVTGWNGLHELGGFAHMGEFWHWARGGDRRPSIFRHLDPYPGAVETLWALARDGHEVVILTAKPDWAIHDTLHWLADHELPTREVHILDDKWRVECDVYLDDSPHVLPAVVDHRPDATVCRFVRSWNQPVDGAVDVADWPGFRQLVGTRAAT